MTLNYFVFLTFGFVYLVNLSSAKYPCDYHMSINITGGSFLKHKEILHNGLKYSPKQYFKYNEEDKSETIRGCICMIKSCMRKCCPEEQVFFNDTCVDSHDPAIYPFNPTVYAANQTIKIINSSEHFGLLFGNPCSDGQRFLLNPEQNDEDFYLQHNGSLYIPNFQNDVLFLHQMSYCMEAFPKNTEDSSESWTTKYFALVCFESLSNVDENQEITFIILSIGQMISIPFLVATFVIYAIIPEIRNLHGKTLMSYVFSLTVAYIFLAAKQISPDNESNFGCIITAFMIYFFFLASFFWLNVMCFDIWLTFSGYQGPRSRGSAEQRRFRYYCIYTLGSPLLLSNLVGFMQFYDNIPGYIVRPNFGDTKCWFDTYMGSLVYFYVPFIILMLCNLFFFISTSFKIRQFKKETAILKTSESSKHDQYDNDKHRLNLYIKLFFLMGVNWTAECVSFIIEEPKWFWFIFDVLNTLFGVFIFIIFVWKKKIKILLIRRYNYQRYGNVGSGDRSSSRFRTYKFSSVSGTDYNRTCVSELSQPESSQVKVEINAQLK